MISRLKVIRFLLGGCLLGLSFGTPLQATEKPSAPERTDSGLSAQREGDRVKPDQHTENLKTIKGEVVRLKGQHFYLRQSNGKEMHLHAKPTTEMKREIKQGDRIEVQVDDQNNALSILQAK